MAAKSSSDEIDMEQHVLPTSSDTSNKKPWYKTPSAYWLLPMFIVIAMTSGLSAAAGTQLYVLAVCHDLYPEKVPLSFKSNLDDACINADVQAKVAQYLAKSSLFTAIPAIFVLGPLGTLSDRKGRKSTLLISAVGTFLTTLNLLLVSNFYDKVGLYTYLIGSFIDGVTGGFYALAEASYAYATDCTHPTRRSVMFGWIQGAMFAGYSAGPTIGGYLIKATDNLLSVYYVTLVIYILLVLFYLFILPESLSKDKLFVNLKRQQELFSINWTGMKWIDSFLGLVYSMFRPLLLFLPNGRRQQNIESDKVPISATKYSFSLLAVVYSLLSASIMAMSGVTVLYTSLVFKWTLIEQGYFIFLMSGTKVFVLFVLYPLLVRFKKQILLLLSKFKSIFSKNMKNNTEEQVTIDDDRSEETLLKKELIFEVWVIRIVFLIDGLAHVAYGLAKSGSLFNGVTVIAAIGIITTPAIKSLQTNLIFPTQIGQLLGGISVIDSLLRIVVPPIFDNLYAVLVKTSPGSIWHCISVLLFIAFFVSFGIGPPQ
ncbi:18548_t:CDS:2 [Funneliformis geosporum]|uniref:14141_t:CDS:1 n=1 Tax=Funneliformis geosporum TaxID=1117311 RepID=A0A9W4WUA9_9GLOM|nr:14141_t:CDS:2 [Funneliformis geosporum]CAI2191559.1 18548_t:CDS:2 [Funneliformis geosporum]